MSTIKPTFDNWLFFPSRRQFLIGGAGIAAAASLPVATIAATLSRRTPRFPQARTKENAP
jgi:hypothetical protein